MNYFELFSLPISFQIDTTQLRSVFMEIQRSTHPDKFASASEKEQQIALEKSVLANKGFTLLNNAEQRLAYVLELVGYLETDEKYVLSPSYLMEMMDLNEQWMEAETPDTKDTILKKVQSIQNEIYSPIQIYLEMASVDTISKEGMLQIKDYYYKKKYLDRILADFR